MGQLGQYAGNDGHLHLVQHVGYAIVRHGIHDRIAENDLAIVSGSRVVVEHGLYVGEQQPFDFGQLPNKVQCLLLGSRQHVAVGAVVAELQATGNLGAQQAVEFFHADTDLVRPNLFFRLPVVKVVGENDAFNKIHHSFYTVDRRQRMFAARHEALFLFRHFCQQRHVAQQYFIQFFLVHFLLVFGYCLRARAYPVPVMIQCNFRHFEKICCKGRK